MKETILAGIVVNLTVAAERHGLNLKANAFFVFDFSQRKAEGNVIKLTFDPDGEKKRWRITKVSAVHPQGSKTWTKFRKIHQEIETFNLKNNKY